VSGGHQRRRRRKHGEWLLLTRPWTTHDDCLVTCDKHVTCDMCVEKNRRKKIVVGGTSSVGPYNSRRASEVSDTRDVQLTTRASLLMMTRRLWQAAGAFSSQTALRPGFLTSAPFTSLHSTLNTNLNLSYQMPASQFTPEQLASLKTTQVPMSKMMTNGDVVWHMRRPLKTSSPDSNPLSF
jgi:hypothetical protein